MLSQSTKSNCSTYILYLLGGCFVSIVAGLSLAYGLDPIKVSNRYLVDDSIVINNVTLSVESLPVSIYMANRWVAGMTITQFILCCMVIGVMFYTAIKEPNKWVVGVGVGVLVGSGVGFMASLVGAITLARLGNAGRVPIESVDPQLVTALEGWEPLLVMSVIPGTLSVGFGCYLFFTSKSELVW